MSGQFPDKKTIGIPSDMVRLRQETQDFRDEAKKFAQNASNSANAAQISAAQSGQFASAAQFYASESERWAKLRSKAVAFGPKEPASNEKFDGMTWLKTDEDTREIIAIKRWDYGLLGQGLLPSMKLLPSMTALPHDRGEWTDFTINLGGN